LVALKLLPIREFWAILVSRGTPGDDNCIISAARKALKNRNGD
jgi:hypothetical protein